MNNKKIQWFKSEFPGIRYYIHNSRKHGVQFDKYFSGQYQVAGKRKAIGFGWMSEGWSAKKAWQKLNEFKHNAKTGEGPTTLKEEQKLKQEQKAAEEAERQRLKNRNLSFSDFFTHTYFPQAREDKKESSCRKELGMFNKWIAPAIGEKGLQEISVSDLEAIKKVMSNAGCSTRLIQYCLAVIRQMFNRAIALELLDYKNPVSKIKIPSPNNKRTRFLSEEEANKLLNGLAEHSQDLHDMALLSLHCGLRSGEIFKLTWNDVDFDQRTIHIRDAKANKDRFAYMTLKVLDMFQSRYELSENKLIFPNRKGRERQTLSGVFQDTVRELGLNDNVSNDREKICFHSLRHTFASWQVQSGMDLYTLQKLLGHESFSMVQRYAHLAPENLREATAIFDNR